MNAGKLIATIAVAAILVYCCYDAFSTAVPNDMSKITNPFDIEGDSMEFSSSSEGMDFVMTLSGLAVTSHLPQEVSDVCITMYLGSGDEKLKIGDINIGDIKPEVKTDIDGKMEVPVYAVIPYAACSDSESGSISIPICMKLAFKYLEWNNSHLIDMNLTVKQSLSLNDCSTPVFTSDAANNSAKVSIDSSNSIISDAAESLKASHYLDTDGKFVIKSGDSQFVIQLKNVGGKDTVSFECIGTSEKDAVQILTEQLTNDGTLTFTSDTVDDIPPLSKEQSQAFINVVSSIYNSSEASA